MILQVKSNGTQVEMKRSIYDLMTEDQKFSYNVISDDSPAAAAQEAVKNEVKKQAPPTGEDKK